MPYTKLPANWIKAIDIVRVIGGTVVMTPEKNLLFKKGENRYTVPKGEFIIREGRSYVSPETKKAIISVLTKAAPLVVPIPKPIREEPRAKESVLNNYRNLLSRIKTVYSEAVRLEGEVNSLILNIQILPVIKKALQTKRLIIDRIKKQHKGLLATKHTEIMSKMIAAGIVRQEIPEYGEVAQEYIWSRRIGISALQAIQRVIDSYNSDLTRMQVEMRNIEALVISAKKSIKPIPVPVIAPPLLDPKTLLIIGGATILLLLLISKKKETV